MLFTKKPLSPPEAAPGQDVRVPENVQNAKNARQEQTVQQEKSDKKIHRAAPQKVTAPQKLKLLFTVVNRQKADFYLDLIESFQVNMQLSFAASGTATTEILQYLGLSDTEKTVIISIIREDRAKDALSLLEEKFRTVRNGKGIACTVPLSSTIGVAIYQFLSNQPS